MKPHLWATVLVSMGDISAIKGQAKFFSHCMVFVLTRSGDRCIKPCMDMVHENDKGHLLIFICTQKCDQPEDALDLEGNTSLHASFVYSAKLKIHSNVYVTGRIVAA